MKTKITLLAICLILLSCGSDDKKEKLNSSFTLPAINGLEQMNLKFNESSVLDIKKEITNQQELNKKALEGQMLQDIKLEIFSIEALISDTIKEINGISADIKKYKYLRNNYLNDLTETNLNIESLNKIISKKNLTQDQVDNLKTTIYELKESVEIYRKIVKDKTNELKTIKDERSRMLDGIVWDILIDHYITQEEKRYNSLIKEKEVALNYNKRMYNRSKLKLTEKSSELEILIESGIIEKINEKNQLVKKNNSLVNHIEQVDTEIKIKSKILQELSAKHQEDTTKRQQLVGQLNEETERIQNELEEKNITPLNTIKLEIINKIKNKNIVGIKEVIDGILTLHNQKPDPNKIPMSELKKVLSSLALDASNPIETFKFQYEELLSSRHHQGDELIYNQDFNRVVNPLYNNRVQCYSGTMLFLTLNELSSQTHKNKVVIFQSGHVLPGFISIEKNKIMLYGIETTAAGKALIHFGETNKIQGEIRVFDAHQFMLMQLLKNEISNFTEVYKQMLSTVSIYGFNTDNFKILDENNLKQRGNNNLLNLTLFGFGSSNAQSGDIIRESFDIQYNKMFQSKPSENVGKDTVYYPGYDNPKYIDEEIGPCSEITLEFREEFKDMAFHREDVNRTLMYSNKDIIGIYPYDEYHYGYRINQRCLIGKYQHVYFVDFCELTENSTKGCKDVPDNLNG